MPTSPRPRSPGGLGAACNSSRPPAAASGLLADPTRVSPISAPEARSENGPVLGPESGPVLGPQTDPKCSYCKQHKETELHIYTQCTATQRFWNEAATWFRQNIDERLPRVIQDKPKIFGYWNERPDDNSNIFLRSARYTIFRGRKSGTIYTLKAFKTTLADELSYKYKG